MQLTKKLFFCALSRRNTNRSLWQYPAANVLKITHTDTTVLKEAIN